MPILIRGNGGAKEFASITAKDTGEIIASTKKGTSHHWLSSNDDADFVAENIKSGVEIFGKSGTFKGYEYALQNTDIAIGKQSITIPCSFTPKAVLLMTNTVDRNHKTDFPYLVLNFGHFPELGCFFEQRRETSTGEEGLANITSYDKAYFRGAYNVQYSDRSVTVSILDEEYGFASYLTAIVFG